jgi:hypothetical protein
MGPAEFLDLACELGVANRERIVNDSQFHPLLKDRGLSDAEIERLKAILAAQGKIVRSAVDGGYFEIAKQVFVDYAIREVPASTVNRARELCAEWVRPGGGDATAQRLATELSLPEFQAVMLFAYCVLYPRR